MKFVVIVALVAVSLAIVQSLEIVISDKNGRTSIDDDNLLEKALKKALKPLGAKGVDVDHYTGVPGAFEVSITSDYDKSLENKDHLTKALQDLKFEKVKIEDAVFGDLNLPFVGIRDRYVVYLDPDTFVKTMESFAPQFVDTSTIGSELRGIKLAVKDLVTDKKE